MLIEVKNLNKYVGSTENRLQILKDINFSIRRGEFVAIVGQSGSGKSTLMNMLGCLDRADSGSYRLDETAVENLDANNLALLRSKKFGFVFQQYNLLPDLSALENAALPGIYAGISHAKCLERAAELLAQMQLQDKQTVRPGRLSGGQQQRISIARALMNGGEIILADEPTGALDSQSGANVMATLQELNRQGHTIILVTHDRNIAANAQRIIELRDGKIIADSGSVLPDDAEGQLDTSILRSSNRFIQYREQIRESLRMALQAIFSHKMRSALTMLGIIIGIASVVSVVALGRGSQEKIIADINAMGTNTIEIFPGKDFGDMDAWRIKTLKADDATMLNGQSYIDNATPNVSASGVLVRGNITVTAELNGVNEQYFYAKGTKTASGRMLTAKDIQDNTSVVVIDQNTEKVLFPDGSNALGQIIVFNRQPLEIIGVTEKQNSMFDYPGKLNLWAPYTTVMYKISGQRNISSIIVKINDSIIPQIAEKNLTDLLTIKHGKKDFFTVNTDSIKKTVENAIATLRILISGIALISLVVGGIGIMNIMLVSVTERTKEIGIRMAIGAKQQDILAQFLIEAVLLCAIGGLLGVSFSFLIGIAINSSNLGVQMNYSIASIVLAMFCSMTIGIMFGFMPARSASRLNPIDALARE